MFNNLAEVKQDNWSLFISIFRKEIFDLYNLLSGKEKLLRISHWHDGTNHSSSNPLQRCRNLKHSDPGAKCGRIGFPSKSNRAISSIPSAPILPSRSRRSYQTTTCTTNQSFTYVVSTYRPKTLSLNDASMQFLQRREGENTCDLRAVGTRGTKGTIAPRPHILSGIVAETFFKMPWIITCPSSPSPRF